MGGWKEWTETCGWAGTCGRVRTRGRTETRGRKGRAAEELPAAAPVFSTEGRTILHQQVHKRRTRRRAHFYTRRPNKGRGLITNNYTPKTKHTRALTKKERYTLDMQVRKCKGRKALVYDEGYSKQQNSFEFKSYKK